MIAVWGANGFIGRNLVGALSSSFRGNIKLFSRSFDGFDCPLSDAITLFEYDFTKIDDYIDQLLDCDTLILLVSASNVGSFAGGLTQEIVKNVTPYKKLLDALAECDNKLKHLIYLSSGGAVYGKDVFEPITENSPLNPISPYGEGKVLIENYIIEASLNAAWNYSILRVANPVGIGSKKGLIKSALDTDNSNNSMTIWGDGSAVRDYFSVDELVLAIELLIKTPVISNNIYNVGSGKGHSISEVISCVSDVVGYTIPIIYNKERGVDVPYNVLDCNKINNEIGWKAEKDLKDIIQTMWDER